MANRTINSGAINAVPFPGAEQGLSLVELVGTVELVCEIPSVTLRINIGAATDADAVPGSATTFKKSRLGASVVASAGSTASARIKVRVIPAATPVATASASIKITHTFEAETLGSASVAATAFDYVKRQAQISAVAQPSATAVTRVERRAQTSGLGLGSVTALRKRPVGAFTQGASTLTAGIKLRQGVTAETTCVASESSPLSRVRVRRAGSTIGTATWSVSAFRKLITVPYSIEALAVVYPVLSYRGMYISPSTAPEAVAAEAGIYLKYFLSADATGSPITVAAAADYSTTQPAPAERLMTVPVDDRRMEVQS
jgi:hypothetical protein